MENRNGLIIDDEVIQPSGTAEREAALRKGHRLRPAKRRRTLAGDKNFDTQDWGGKSRKRRITSHAAQNISATASAPIDPDHTYGLLPLRAAGGIHLRLIKASKFGTLVGLMNAIACNRLDVAHRSAACGDELAVSAPRFDIFPGMVDPDKTRQNVVAAYRRVVSQLRPDTAGRILLELTLSRYGRVIEAKPIERSGSPVLDSLGVSLATAFRFTPAYKGASPVCARITVPMFFPPD